VRLLYRCDFEFARHLIARASPARPSPGPRPRSRPLGLPARHAASQQPALMFWRISARRHGGGRRYQLDRGEIAAALEGVGCGD
jgi:hypothetical protein